ncbi:MAG TPA: helix-turn-helix transcriptional regulator [Thermoanaerobaculia bacterium]|nr:helix-turn-helix transcriptional regulator [Thermoanaerobaculia bacterium]
MRTEQDIGLAAVAEQAGISIATLSRVETNKQSIEVGLLLTLARILGVSPADILREPDESGDLQSLSRRVAALPPTQRTKVFMDSSRRQKGKDLQPVLDDLVSTVDLLREELLSVQRAVRRRKR